MPSPRPVNGLRAFPADPSTRVRPSRGTLGAGAWGLAFGVGSSKIPARFLCMKMNRLVHPTRFVCPTGSFSRTACSVGSGNTRPSSFAPSPLDKGTGRGHRPRPDCGGKDPPRNGLTRAGADRTRRRVTACRPLGHRLHGGSLRLTALDGLRAPRSRRPEATARHPTPNSCTHFGRSSHWSPTVRPAIHETPGVLGGRSPVVAFCCGDVVFSSGRC